MRASRDVAFLGLGSNVGDRAGHLRYAVRRLSGAGRLTGLSSVYETQPVGYLDQAPFLNVVLRMETRLSPSEILDLSARIEAERGRERTFRNAPRTLDIDLLLLGDRVIRTPELMVPHPRMGERPFVLVPLLELEPDAGDPVTGARYADRLAALTGGSDGELRAAGVARLMSADALLEEEDG